MLRHIFWMQPVAVDEAVSLETDVMRFMAILGFCLMIVFALVQALPVSSASPEKSRPVPPARAAELAAPQPTLSATALPSKPVTSPANTPVPTPAPTKDNPSPVPAAQPTMQPQWSLHFASDDALLQLLQKNTIALYLRSRGDLHQLYANGDMRPVTGTFKLYRMEPHTVPSVLRELVKSRLRDADPEWSIALSAPLLQTIATAMNQQPPTRLLIHADAAVRRAEPRK